MVNQIFGVVLKILDFLERAIERLGQIFMVYYLAGGVVQKTLDFLKVQSIVRFSVSFCGSPVVWGGLKKQIFWKVQSNSWVSFCDSPVVWVV